MEQKRNSESGPDAVQFCSGQYVRFKYLPSGMKPTPIKITGVTIRGLLYLEGHKGTFAAKLFELVEESKEVM